MHEYWGSTSIAFHMATRSFPKAHLLLFDRIVVGNLVDGIERLRHHVSDRYAVYADNLEWLHEEGVLADASEFGPPIEPQVLEELRMADLAQERMEAAFNRARDDRVDDPTPLHHEALAHYWDLHGFAARALAWHLQATGRDVVPLVGPTHLEAAAPQGARTAATLEIVMNQVPVPGDDVPFDDILAFKRDRETRERLMALRRWMRSVAEGDQQPAYVSEELEFLRIGYEAQVKRLTSKARLANLRTVATILPAMLENVVKLKLKDSVAALFSVAEAQHALLDEERKAPGREVSYLVSLDREFAHRGAQV